MNTYNVGDLVTLSVTFANSSGPADPDEVALEIQGTQDVAPAVYSYALSELSRSSQGVYTLALTPTRSGHFTYTWTGTGNVQGTESGEFYVRVRPHRGAVRETLQDLIGRVRVMVNDPWSAAQVFEDEDYQAWLDLHRTEVRLVELEPDPIIASGGKLSFEDFYAPKGLGPFEQDAIFQGPSWDTITPDDAEWLVGHFHFDTSHVFPIFVTGKAFDLSGAAADALEAWANKVALEFGFSSDGQRFDRQQKRTALLEQAREYRKKQQPRRASLGRRDTAC